MLVGEAVNCNVIVFSLSDRGLFIMPTMFACYMIVILIGALSIVRLRLLVMYTHTIYWQMYTLPIIKYYNKLSITC